MSKFAAQKIAERYAQKLRKENFPLFAIYLFGSYTKGIPKNESDIDVAVLSDKLKKDWNKKVAAGLMPWTVSGRESVPGYKTLEETRHNRGEARINSAPPLLHFLDSRLRGNDEKML